MLNGDLSSYEVENYVHAIRDAIEEYKKLAFSHAVTPTVKTRILLCISKVEKLLTAYISKNTPLIREKINELIDDAILMTPSFPRTGMTLLHNLDDIRVRQDSVKLTYRNGKYYTLKRCGDLSVADGDYCFIIPVSAPWEVWLSKRTRGGHTSISRGCDVYFAGELLACNGSITCWSNNSGHYRTPANLSGQADKILPLKNYQPVQ